MAEEPFEGEHWEGILDPIRSPDDWDSTPSLSPLNSDDLALDDDDDSFDSSDPAHRDLESSTSSPVLPSKPFEPPYTTLNPKPFEDLRERQYWRKDWKSDADPTRPFDLGDPSTLGPTISRSMAGTRRSVPTEVCTSFYSQRNFAAKIIQKYINEEDMVREILMALQGRDNIALEFSDGRYQVCHLTLSHLHD